MPEEILGYVELEWNCPNCGTKNPGKQRTCTSCGGTMGEDGKFTLPEEHKLITDEKKLAEAGKGADIHCPFCGTRNPADAKTCSQCGGDLTGAKQHAAGQVLGAFTPGQVVQVTCPACQTLNSAAAAYCVKCGSPLKAKIQAEAPAAPVKPARLSWLVIGLLALAGICGVAVIGMIIGKSVQRKTISAYVLDVQWQRSVAIEALQPEKAQAWRDEIPAKATLGSCERSLRDRSDSPQGDSVKVCGTPYTVDQGDGTGKVVQDCYYEVYDQACTYTMMTWQVVDTVSVEGADVRPYWPDVSLQTGQRQGQQTETYQVRLAAGEPVYTYVPQSEAEFTQFQLDSRWQVTLDGFNHVVSVEPE